MATTYEPIATYTAPSAQASYTFTSIPATYTDLVVIVAGTTVTDAQDMSMQFNSDTGANYSETRIVGNGTTASSTRTSSQTKMYVINDTSNTSPTVLRINIMNYTNTTTYKTAVSRGDDSTHRTQASVGLWRSTAAISSVTILGTSNLNTGTVLTLYGIKAA
jgi:hypothetical protein